MVPLLTVLNHRETVKRTELYELTAETLGLSLEQRNETLSSGGLRYTSQVDWALHELLRVEAVERPARAEYRITAIGRDLLKRHPVVITAKDLKGLGTEPPTPSLTEVESDSVDLTPAEQVAAGMERLDAAIATELISRLHSQSPSFFEQAVLDLVMAMGFGGTDGRAIRTQLVNDGGIDGIIEQDILGLSNIYIQAKRYAPGNSVGRPEIQGFVGALHGKQADRGVFITTGKYSSGARAYAKSISTRVVLIDGARLASLMIRYGVGVQVKRTVHIVEIDEDFFE